MMVSNQKYKEQETIAAQYAKSIYESVEGMAPTQVKHGPESKLMGLSGQEHQIDVSIWGLNDLILIECKHREEIPSIGVDMVLAFFGRLYDIRQYLLNTGQFRQIHGIMVASKPFQSGAKKVAKFYGIDLQSSDSITYFGLRYKKLVVVHPPPARVALTPRDPVVTLGRKIALDDLS